MPLEVFVPVFVALLIGPFVVATLWLYHALRLPAHPLYYALDPDDPLIPPDFVHLTEQTERDLYPAGFRLVSAAYTPTVQRATTFLALFENPTARDTAILAIRYRLTLAGLLEPLCRHMTYLSEYPTGLLILTDNAPTLGLASDPPHLRRHNYPGVQDLAALYRLHRAATAPAAPQRPGSSDAATPKCLPAQLDPIHYLVDIATRRAYHHLSTGTWQLDDDTDTLTPSFSAAARIAFTEVYPLPLLSALPARRRASRLLQLSAAPCVANPSTGLA